MTSFTHPAPNSLVIDGQRIAYRTAGDPNNPALLMIHGWMSHSRVWRMLMPQLEATHYCVAVDLLGFADSDKPHDREAYTIAAQAKRVIALADALNLDRFAQIGHSMGGQIALHVASALAPERVTHLVMVDSVVSGKVTPFVRYFSQSQLELGRMLPFLVPPVAWLIRKPAIAKIMFSIWFHHQPPFKQWREDLYRTNDPRIVTPACFAGRAFLRTDLTPDLPCVTARTLVVFGRQDRVVSFSEGELAAQGIAGAQSVWFDECGHFPMFEYTDRFNQTVRDFLSPQP